MSNGSGNLGNLPSDEWADLLRQKKWQHLPSGDGSTVLGVIRADFRQRNTLREPIVPMRIFRPSAPLLLEPVSGGILGGSSEVEN